MMNDKFMYDIEEEKISEKIRKLLSLAEKNQNEEEANAALLKAQDLMVKYRIETWQTTKEVVCHVSVDMRATAQWEEWLFSVICKNYRCVGYYQKGIPVFLGLEEDATTAKQIYCYAHEFARKVADRMYQQELKKKGTGKGVRNSYLRGFVAGLKKQFDEALDHVFVSQDGQVFDKQLILSMPSEVTTYYERFKQNLQERKFRSSNQVSFEAYQKGYRDGKKLQADKKQLQ